MKNKKLLAARGKSTVWFSPPVLVAAVWGFVFVLRSLPLVQFEPLATETSLFLLSCYLGFALFHAAFSLPFFPPGSSPQAPATQAPAEALVRLVTAFAIVGLIGAAIRAFDIYFGRGLDFSQGIAAARLQNISQVESMGEGQSPLSGIARMLATFASIAAMATILRWEQIPANRARLILAIFGLTICESILEGGRNTIAVNLLFVACCALVRMRQHKEAIPGGRRALRVVALVLAVVPLFFAYVFVDRFEALGHSETAFAALETVFNVEFSPALTDSQGDVAVGLATSAAGIIIYVAHAVSELGWVLEWSRQNSLQLGSYNFALVAVSLERLGLENLSFDPTTLTRVGLYMSALGELVIDYGLAGTVVVCSVLGAVFGTWWRRAKHNSTVGTELGLSLGMTALIVSPLYSIVPGFLGTLVAALLFVFLLGRKTSKRRVVFTRSPA